MPPTTLGRLNPIITWPHEVTWLIKNDISSLTRGLGRYPLSFLTLWSRNQVIPRQMENVISQFPRDLWLLNLTGWWVLMRACYPSSHITCWSRGHIRSHDKWKCYKFTFLWPVAIKLEKRVVYLLPQTHIFLSTWFREFTWQMNIVIFLLLPSLLLLNLTGWWLVMRSHHLKSSVVLWSRDHVQSRDELETFYLQSQKLYGHQTWQVDNLWHESITHKVTSTFDQFVKWGHVRTLKPYSKRSMATKPDMLMRFNKTQFVLEFLIVSI